MRTIQGVGLLEPVSFLPPYLCFLCARDGLLRLEITDWQWKRPSGKAKNRQILFAGANTYFFYATECTRMKHSSRRE